MSAAQGRNTVWVVGRRGFDNNTTPKCGSWGIRGHKIACALEELALGMGLGAMTAPSGNQRLKWGDSVHIRIKAKGLKGKPLRPQPQSFRISEMGERWNFPLQGQRRIAHSGGPPSRQD